MRRVLVIRYVALVFAPIAVLAVFSIFWRQYLQWASVLLAVAVLTNAGLSVRDGAILDRGFAVCLRKEEGALFWIFIGIQIALALFVVLLPLLFAK